MSAPGQDRNATTMDPADAARVVIGLPGEAVAVHARRRKSHAPVRLGLTMTSMIDVVFLLLIYFLVATDFRLGEEIYRLDLPNREGGGSADPFELDREPLRISVISTGLSADLYQVAIEGPYPQPRDFEELSAFLTARQVGAGGSTAMFEPDHPIIIQPTRSTRWEHAIEAFNAAARARYTNVTFSSPR